MESVQQRDTSRISPTWNGIDSRQKIVFFDCGAVPLKDSMALRPNVVFKRTARTSCLLLQPTTFAKCTLSVTTSDSRLGYFFGGFGGLLCIAGIICIICYEPLGLPTPDASNLALGVLLFLVVIIQAAFNAWQDWV